MTAFINGVCLVNRAYQVLYALGDDSSTVRTLTSSEASALVGIVQDIYSGHRETPLDLMLSESMSRGMLRYVAEGVI